MHICIGDVGVDLKMEMKTIVFYLFMSCLSLYFDKSELIESQTKLSRIKWVYSSNFWSEISDLENFEEGAETIKDEETVVGGKRCLSCFVNNRLCYAIWQKKKKENLPTTGFGSSNRWGRGERKERRTKEGREELGGTCFGYAHAGSVVSVLGFGGCTAATTGQAATVAIGVVAVHFGSSVMLLLLQLLSSMCRWCSTE